MVYNLVMEFVQVLIDAAAAGASAADTVFDYRVPPELVGLIKPFMRVIVPFGVKNRPQISYAVSLSDSCAYDVNKVKTVIRLVDAEPVIPPYLAQTALFLRENYFCSYAEAVRCVLPAAEKLVRKTAYFPAPDFSSVSGGLSPAEENICGLVAGKPGASAVYLKGKSSLSHDELINTLASLLKKGALVSDEEFDFENREKLDEFYTLAEGDNTLDDYLLVIGSRARKQRDAVSYMFGCGKKEVSRRELIEKAAVSAAVIKTLCDMHLIEKIRRRTAAPIESGTAPPAPPLTEAQAECVRRYRQNAPGGKYLLFGVTGSGKTRVFFEIFDTVLARGKQCLLLVPEISLTPQMMALVKGRFGGIAAVMHSKLTPSERYAEFLKIKRGEARIVLGARSALFMPFKALGVVVIDEEHETSYKSSQSPRYDTIETAGEICRLTGADLILASATPSIASFMRAQRGELTLLKLPVRVNNIPLPVISVTDMRAELKSGNRTPLSRVLREKMTERLEKGEQTLLFLNRRGYNTYVFCRSCGHIEMCPNCEVSLTSHLSSNTLTCHYCGYKAPIPRVCPECGSDKIKFMGSGTEKIEASVRAEFPEARVLRLDSDVATTKNAYEHILNRFASGEADILIGTQMIVKGLDFANVTLVGILLADASLNFPDINAAARTFQLTAQAAGRAGRRGERGEVIMQTYKPDNPTLIYCAQHDYEGFYAYDIEFRRKMNYPPFTEILGIFAADEDLTRCMADAETVFNRTEALVNSSGYDNIKLYRPAPAFIQKLKNKYIYHVLVRYEKNSPFKGVMRERYADIRKGLRSYIYTEIDPVTLL